MRLLLPLAAPVALAIACSSSNSSPPAASTPCSDYFDVLISSPCGTGPSLPSDEQARVVARFEQVCRSSLSLPGSQLDDAQLQACTAAIKAEGCNRAATLPAACTFLGTLAAGSACNEGFQCTGGLCFQSASVGDAGPQPPGACGKCEAVVAAGQPCVTGTCEQGTVCDPTSTRRTCVRPTSGAAGASCNGATTVCNAGLFCDVSTSKCVATFATGHACGSSSECTAPDTCRAKTCQAPSQAGGGCYVDTDCAAGLGCSAGMQCGAVVWQPAGQPCGDLQRCVVGNCSPAGTCPTVVADGQPCPTDQSSTCDSLALCLDGKCALEDSAVCM